MGEGGRTGIPERIDFNEEYEMPLLQGLDKRYNYYSSRIEQTLREVYVSRDLNAISSLERALSKLCRQAESGELRDILSLPSMDLIPKIQRQKIVDVTREIAKARAGVRKKPINYDEYKKLRDKGCDMESISGLYKFSSRQQLGGYEGAYQKYKK